MTVALPDGIPENSIPAVCDILGTGIHILTPKAACRRIIRFALAGGNRMVCAANVHMLIEAYRDPAFRTQLNDADLIVPDGMPLSWIMRWSGLPDQERIAGPDLMLDLCKAASDAGIHVGFLGGRPEVLHQCVQRAVSLHPSLRVSFMHSPPFRPLSDTEDVQLVRMINDANVDLLFVAFGCPRQERWMHEHRGQVDAVMVGLGAAFDFLAGTTRRAPVWMQRHGLEWAFRLCREPRRLWRRYLLTNTMFIALTFPKLLRGRQLHDKMAA